MAAKNKTTETDVDVTDFVNSYVDDDRKRADSFQLIKLMTKWSGFKPRMWGPTIIGFGKYHYRYASGHEGDAALIGFSPRNAEFSLYVIAPDHDYGNLLNSLGKYRMGKSCIYFKKLSDLDVGVLEELSNETIRYIHEKYESAGHG